MKKFTEVRDAVRAERRAEIDQWEQGNVSQARDVRERYLASQSVPAN